MTNYERYCKKVQEIIVQFFREEGLDLGEIYLDGEALVESAWYYWADWKMFNYKGGELHPVLVTRLGEE